MPLELVQALCGVGGREGEEERGEGEGEGGNVCEREGGMEKGT